MNTVVFPAAINKCEMLADGTMKLGMYVTGELPQDEMATLMGLVRKEGYCAFSENQKEVTEAERPNENAPNAKVKSPSQKLRARMFVYKQGTTGTVEFEKWYEQELDRIGLEYLSKLEAPELTEY